MLNDYEKRLSELKKSLPKHKKILKTYVQNWKEYNVSSAKSLKKAKEFCELCGKLSESYKAIYEPTSTDKSTSSDNPTSSGKSTSSGKQKPGDNPKLQARKIFCEKLLHHFYEAGKKIEEAIVKSTDNVTESTQVLKENPG